MDWPGSRTTHSLGQQAAEEEMDDGEEDFYGLGANTNGNHTESHAVLGASNRQQNGISSTPFFPGKIPLDTTLLGSTSNAEQLKANNQKKAADLRAKLLAQRQATPIKGLSRADTPSKAMTMPQQEPQTDKHQQDTQSEQRDSSSDIFGLESLLAEGKAAAEAKMKQNITQQPQTGSEEASSPVDATKTDGGNDPVPTTSISDNQVDGPKSSIQPTALTDAYYADLAIWLEVTGYHDVEYRNSKLRTYKERKALEQEAARIAERLEKLRQAEQAEIASIRTTVAHPATTQQPPSLPATMPDAASLRQTPTGKAATPAQASNGLKRARSPEPLRSEKSVRRGEESTDFRFRGVDGTPETRPTAAFTAYSPPSTGLERRISYPEARRVKEPGRAGIMKIEPRDQSLERRQAYYKRDANTTAQPLAYNRDNRFDRSEYSNHVAGRPLDRGDRPARGAPDRASVAPRYREYPQQYRGSLTLDLRKGGVRYFMIKSWNHQNVTTAMHDGLWATQEKNERLLTEAFRTSRHVILLFSVNKSVAFQGYALMTSAPDPNLPKPAFCAKLNWATSPAFSLRWLGTTSVHFRFVGHLKNSLNLDDHGQPFAVLVGKDGQEISTEAGMGVVNILDEAQEERERKQGHLVAQPNGHAASEW